MSSAITHITTRQTDTSAGTARTGVDLPAIDWASIGQTAPVRLPIGPRKAGDPLPPADIVVLTWTSAEWFALDHVFLNSATRGSSEDQAWRSSWLPYTRGASGYSADPMSGQLWGSFQMVRITDRSGRPWRVLLFKCNAHLAHSPWLEGLSAMLRAILEDAKPDRIYTIGTAGGARLEQKLGDSVIANAAMLSLQRSQNTVDPDNGNMYRCPTWYPSTSLIETVESKLLFRMDQVVTEASLKELFKQLKEKHLDDPRIGDLTVNDLINDPLRPESLAKPKVWPLKDTPLLTTDFYFIAGGDNAEAYSFLEMDDAIIGREANKLGVRFACLRNISDPIVPLQTKDGTPLSDSVRADWSGLIYNTFGTYTSVNGALVTWATIAGEGLGTYNPPRSTASNATKAADDDPLEVKLVFEVRSCGKCCFFWPEKKNQQPYGPYTAFDFDVNVPYPAAPGSGPGALKWVTGRTRPPAFPNGEVIDGCRKAPIMTIGINPNMTAFLPGQTGAAWAYPNFSSDNDTDAWAKYAWYYRYRTVYQERLDLDFVRKFILPQGQIIAERDGKVISGNRPDDNPAWTINVRYEGDAEDTILALPGKIGDFPYVLLLDWFEPNNAFRKGDVIAGRLSVPAGIQTEVRQQEQGYYMQFQPVLQQFQSIVRREHPSASLRIGEDVCQLDMVACASPHWNAGFLGGSSPEGIDKIVDNCVKQNAWAIKQMVQTRPAILYIVSIQSWNMFREAFGAHIQRDIPVSEYPVDNDFTLLRETTDPKLPAYINFDITIDGQQYKSRTRLVITPHFSYNTNFLPQYRVSPDVWKNLSDNQAACVAALTPENGFTLVPTNPKYLDSYTSIQLPADSAGAAAARAWLKQEFPVAYDLLDSGYFDPHAMMASVLQEMYAKGDLKWKDKTDGTGYIDRNEGSCCFCVNQHWQFPNECRYGKTKEDSPPAGFLEKVAAQIVATGKK